MVSWKQQLMQSRKGQGNAAALQGAPSAAVLPPTPAVVESPLDMALQDAAGPHAKLQQQGEEGETRQSVRMASSSFRVQAGLSDPGMILGVPNSEVATGGGEG